MVIGGGDGKSRGRSTFSLCEEQRMYSLLVMLESCAAVHTVHSFVDGNRSERIGYEERMC